MDNILLNNNYEKIIIKLDKDSLKFKKSNIDINGMEYIFKTYIEKEYNEEKELYYYIFVKKENKDLILKELENCDIVRKLINI